MPRIPFDQLPPDARLWIFAAAHPLAPDAHQRVLAEVDAFLDQWAAHGIPLTAGRDLRHDRFILLGVDERAAGVSGCSIDALVHRMERLQAVLGVDLLDRGPVLFREGSRIERVSREAFSDLVAAGRVGLDTTVFDNTLTTVGDLRSGRWEVRAADAWHGRALF